MILDFGLSNCYWCENVAFKVEVLSKFVGAGLRWNPTFFGKYLAKKHPTFRFNLIDKATLFPSADKNAT